MPKKFPTENTKAVQARERKQARKEEEHEKKTKAEDDALWADDDKHVMRKQKRKDEKEKKKQETVLKKQELKKLHDEEMESIKGKNHQSRPVPKVTRAEIEVVKAAEEEEAIIAAKKKEKNISVIDELSLEENLNKIVPDGEEARSVEAAISVLSVGGESSSGDRHPEKRMKAAFTAFEEQHLPRLKAENPNLRLSQLKQMLKKDWMKSPENPMNQRIYSQR